MFEVNNLSNHTFATFRLQNSPNFWYAQMYLCSCTVVPIIYHLTLFSVALGHQQQSTQPVAAKSVADYPRTVKCTFAYSKSS